jgi:hypothetical protein
MDGHQVAGRGGRERRPGEEKGQDRRRGQERMGAETTSAGLAQTTQ